MRMDTSTRLRCPAAARREAWGIATPNTARLHNRQNPVQYTTSRATTPPGPPTPRRVVNACACGRLANDDSDCGRRRCAPNPAFTPDSALARRRHGHGGAIGLWASTSGRAMLLRQQWDVAAA